MSYSLPRDLYDETASSVLGEASASGSRFAAGLADATLDADSRRREALAYANAYQEQRNKLIESQKKAQKKKSTSGIFGALGTVASFIPGVGPIAGPILGAAGSLFG